MKKPPLTRLAQFPKESEFNQINYQKLIEMLQYHSWLYHTEDSPQINDREYDEALKLLKNIEEKHPGWKTDDSPTLKIGGEIQSTFPKIIHEPPMLSLDNAMNWMEFLNFENRLIHNYQDDISYHIEPKFDGLAVELDYQNGVLKTGSTRGNGTTGEDITHNIRTVDNIPLRLNNPPSRVTIRGEVLISKIDFEKLNNQLASKGEKTFANPRNAASGSLRQKDSRLTASRKLTFFPYSIGKINDHAPENYWENQSEIWEKVFPYYGFKTSNLNKILKSKELERYYLKIQEERAELPYDIDGLVIKVNQLKAWQILGKTSKFPHWAIALKFPAYLAYTLLEQVQWQTSRTGILTPVANLTPVNIGGVIVKRASLHNASEINRLDVMIGDIVEVKRAGDVIPKIISRKKRGEKSKPISLPKKCPSCQTDVLQETLTELLKKIKNQQVEEKKIKQVIYIRCLNLKCPARKLAQLEYWISKDGLDIDGLGIEWVKKFLERNLIKDGADLFSLTTDKIKNLPGMGKLLPEKIITAIQNRIHIDLNTFIRSLGILHVGSRLSTVLAQRFNSIEELSKTDKKELLTINEIGPSVAKSVNDYFNDKENLEFIERAQRNGLKIKNTLFSNNDLSTENIEQIFYGETFLKDIEWQTNKTGKINPILILKPIKLDKNLINRINLYNVSEITRLNLMLGDLIEISQADHRGIKIVAVKKHNNKPVKIKIPSKCPICQTEVLKEVLQETLEKVQKEKIIKELKKEFTHLFCLNANCPARKLPQLEYWISKNGLNIEGIRFEWIQKLLQKGFIKDSADLLALSIDQIKSSLNVQDEIAKKIFTEIQEKKNICLNIFLCSLGISQVGKNAANLLAKKFSNIEMISKAKKKDFKTILGFGDKIAQTLQDYFEDDKNLEFIQRAQKNGLIIKNIPPSFPLTTKKENTNILDETTLLGKTFVFTGRLTKFTRKEAQEKVKILGAKATSSISNNTDYLVYGDSAGSKLKKAKELNVKTITEEDFSLLLKSLSKHQ